MIRALFLLGGSLLFAVPSFAQYIAEFGEIPAADLLMTAYPDDSSATAVVLYDRAEMVAEADRYTLRHHRRVKLIDRSAFDRAEIDLWYFHKDNRENMYDLEAQIHLPDGRVVALANRDFIRERIDEERTRLRFTFPQLTEGAILEYRYRFSSENVVVPREWLLRESIPVRYAQFSFTNESPYTYRYFLRGVDHLEFSKDSDRQGIYRAGKTQLRIDGTEFILLNAPALRPEPFAGSLSDYLISVQFQLSEYETRGSSKSYLSTWPELAQELMNRPDFGRQLRRTNQAKTAIEAARASIPTGLAAEEQIEAVRRFVARSVRWNGQRGFLTDQSLDDAFSRGQGSGPEIQLLGIVLLREFGIEVYPVLTSTRDHGALDVSYPLVSQFNYLFAGLQLDGGILLVDFLAPELPAGLVRENALNGYGLLVNDKTAQWLTINARMLTDVYFAQLDLDSGGSPTIAIHNVRSGYSAQADRTLTDPAELHQRWRQRIEAVYPEATLDTVWHGEQTDDRQLLTKVRFHLPEADQPTEQYQYIMPAFPGAELENPFQATERQLPVELVYPRATRFQFVVKLPKDYEVAEMPESTHFELPDGGGQFRIEYQSGAQQLSLDGTFELRQTHFAPEAYRELREFFVRAIEHLSEPIVLRRRS